MLPIPAFFHAFISRVHTSSALLSVSLSQSLPDYSSLQERHDTSYPRWLPHIRANRWKWSRAIPVHLFIWLCEGVCANRLCKACEHVCSVSCISFHTPARVPWYPTHQCWCGSINAFTIAPTLKQHKTILVECCESIPHPRLTSSTIKHWKHVINRQKESLFNPSLTENCMQQTFSALYRHLYWAAYSLDLGWVYSIC